MKKIIKFVKNPKWFILALMNKGFFNFLDDKKYIQMKYKLIFNKNLNLDNPTTFNEKLNWLKINDRKDIYTLMADKLLVKKYVEKKIGKEYVIDLYDSWKNVNDINIDNLPNQFVIKCNHDSSGAIICKDKNNFDIDKLKGKLQKYLKRNYYYSCREWPYKNIKPRIIAEKYIEDETKKELRDYKFLCFNGNPKYVYVTVKNSNIWENYYDLDFNKTDINHGFPRYKEEFKKPKNFDKMVEIAKKLSHDIPFVRIDLHNVNGKIYFGEFTFYDWAGFKPYIKEDYDLKLGKMLNIK